MSKKKFLLRGVRQALYWPVEHLSELPGGPLRYMWLIRLVVKLDAPLRRALLGGLNANPTH
jgi:hypothetical protein